MSAARARPRADLWASARAFSDAAGAELSPRARRWATAGDAPLSLTDVDAPPDWAGASAAERARLARLTGAVLVSRAWSRSIDGALLGRAAAAVGDEALEALINLPAVLAPTAADAAAERAEPEALDALGAEALLAATGASPAACARLQRLLPSARSAPVPAGAAAAAVRAAEGVVRAAADGEAAA